MHISYLDLRMEVLDDFFLCLVDKPKDNMSYAEVLGYVLYNYEQGFSDLEMFLVDFVVYVLGKQFKVSENLCSKIKEGLTINKLNHFIYQIKKDERIDLIHEMFLVGIISKDLKNELETKIATEKF